MCDSRQCQLIFLTSHACKNIKLCRCTSHKLMAVGRNSSTHSYRRHQMEANCHIYFKANLLRGMVPLYPLNRRLCGTRSDLVFLQEERNLLSLLQIDPHFFSIPLRRHDNTGTALYRNVIFLQQFIVSQRRIV